MPILAQEPDIFPENLLEVPVHEQWWVVYTRSRQEKQMMRKLREGKVPHYCPLIPTRSKSPQGRIRTSYLPLFSNYLFLNGTMEERLMVLQTNCASRIIEVNQPSQLVFDLGQVRGLILSGAPVSPEARIEPGDRVRIRSGPFKGYEGVVLQRQGKSRLLVDVRFMNQGASVELEDCLMERI
jgi:transcription antitermination factor NusG